MFKEKMRDRQTDCNIFWVNTRVPMNVSFRKAASLPFFPIVIFMLKVKVHVLELSVPVILFCALQAGK